MRRIGLLAALLALALAAPAGAAEPRASLTDIEDEVMCVVCGVPLEHALDAPQAIQERDLIRQLIDQGLTKEQIKDRLVAEYGEEVLAVPSDSGFDLAAWLVPGAAIVIAAVAIFVALRRWRRRGDGGPAEPPAGERLADADEKRLDEDLARYRL
jgi:cytochrome c-type biogenesis protein CcmH